MRITFDGRWEWHGCGLRRPPDDPGLELVHIFACTHPACRAERVALTQAYQLWWASGKGTRCESTPGRAVRNVVSAIAADIAAQKCAAIPAMHRGLIDPSTAAMHAGSLACDEIPSGTKAVAGASSSLRCSPPAR